jgi:hypothetical protein
LNEAGFHHELLGQSTLIPPPTKPTDIENLLPSQDVLRRLAISESGFVFDPASGNSFTVNETGLTILRALQQDYDFSHLNTQLLQQHAVAPRELERDLIEFFGTLRDHLGTS